jgi:ABC-2 type transport system permease protein
MRSVTAILVKELRELGGERDSRRAGAIQIAFISVLVGVLVPLRHIELWEQWAPSVMVPYYVLASLLGSAVAADAFAGERERRTLETLMTTPVSEFDVLLGKACAIVLFGLTAGIVPWLVTLVVLAARGSPMEQAPLMTALCVWLSGCSSFAFGAVAIGVSLKMSSVRTSQQVSSVIILATYAAISFVWQELAVPSTVGALVLAGAAAAVLGGVLLFALSRLFRRERLFERR